jgi:hypothetical protein
MRASPKSATEGNRMPFDPALPRTFNAISIRAHAPMASGVYGLSNARAWLFIGETDNIQESLLEHLRAGSEQATGFCFEMYAAGGRARRHRSSAQQVVQRHHSEAGSGARKKLPTAGVMP